MRISQLYFILIFFVCVFICYSVNPKRVDCRKFVFAPACRGTGAKRDVRHHIFNDDRRYFVPENWFNLLPNEVDDERSNKKQQDKKLTKGLLLESLLKKYSPTVTFDYESGHDNLYK